MAEKLKHPFPKWLRYLIKGTAIATALFLFLKTLERGDQTGVSGYGGVAFVSILMEIPLFFCIEARNWKLLSRISLAAGSLPSILLLFSLYKYSLTGSYAPILLLSVLFIHAMGAAIIFTSVSRSKDKDKTSTSAI